MGCQCYSGDVIGLRAKAFDGKRIPMGPGALRIGMMHDKLVPAGFSVGAFIVGCLACDAPAPRPAEPSLASSAHAVASASSSAAPAASSAAVPDSPRVSPPTDATYDRWREELIKACELPDVDGTTAGITHYTRSLEACADGQIHKLVDGLPLERKSSLLAVAEPRRTVKGDWYPAWQLHIDTACYIDDALTWTTGTQRLAGTMRHNTLPGCFTGRTLEALYWVRAYAANDAATFAAHVRSVAASGPRARQAQTTLRREAEYWAAQAPEGPWFDDGCIHFCTLYDADWRKLIRTLDVFEETTAKLSEGMCRSWPDLGRALGGFAECVREVTSYMTVGGGSQSGLGPDGDGYYETLSKGGERELPEPGSFPPKKDPDYARFVTPLYAACEVEPNRADLDVEKGTRCYGAAFAGELERVDGRDAFEPAWRAFVDDLCDLDTLASSGYYTDMTRGYGEVECKWLAFARGSFLARSWSGGDATAFARHVTHRQAWGAKVRSGLDELDRILAAGPCPDDPAADQNRCRRSWIAGTAWSRSEAGASRIRKEAASLASLVCKGWSGAAKAVGADCQAKLETYFLSYGQVLGTMKH